MCWSAEVSAGFAVGEWAAIAWLWRRDQPLDRAFALAVSPIAAQEALQWLLWEHIAPTATACDRVNVVGSLAIRLIIGLVPLAWVWFARRAAPTSRLARGLWLATLAYVGVRAALYGYGFAVGPTTCTTIGPHHHQAWPSYQSVYPPLQPALDAVMLTLYWTLPVGALLACFRPRWLAIAISAVAVGTLAGALLLLSVDEVGSVWCWSCSLLLVLALVQPRVRAALEVRSRARADRSRPGPGSR